MSYLASIGATLVVPPQPAIELELCKAWARIDGSQHDAVLPMLIGTATEVAEQECAAFFMQRTIRLELADWPSSAFPLHPVREAALSWWDGSGSWIALEGGGAAIVRGRFGVRLARPVSTVWPGLPTWDGPRVRADLVVGYGETTVSVPFSVKQWICAHVAYWVRNPEAASERAMLPSPFLAGLLDPHRTYL